MVFNLFFKFLYSNSFPSYLLLLFIFFISYKSQWTFYKTSSIVWLSNFSLVPISLSINDFSDGVAVRRLYALLDGGGVILLFIWFITELEYDGEGVVSLLW